MQNGHLLACLSLVFKSCLWPGQM